MTQPNTGPTNAPGAADPKKNVAPVAGRPAVESKTQPPALPDDKTACAPNAPVAAPRADSVDKRADDKRDAGGSRSPGSLPVQMVSAQAAEKKPASAPTNAPSSKPDLASPQDPKPVGTTEPIQPNRPKPIQPSRVTEPTVGATGSTGVIADGDEG